jgi:hypothetical protein
MSSIVFPKFKHALLLANARLFRPRLLAHSIHSRLFNPAHIPTILRSLRRTFFPANTFPRHAKPAPDAAAAIASKQRCAAAVLGLIPVPLRKLYLGQTELDGQLAAVESWLDVLGDEYLNRHLVFALLELFVVRLVPEVAERGPKELLGERLAPRGVQG